MPITLVYGIAVLVAGMVGYLIGILAARSQKSDGSQPEAAAAAPETRVEEAPAAPPEKPTPVDEKIAAAEPVSGEHTALRVSVSKALQWKVELDGVILKAGETALSADQRQRLVNILLQVRPWLEAKPAPGPVSPLENLSTPAAPAAQPPVSGSPAPLRSVTPPTAPPAAPKRLTIAGGLASALQTELGGKKPAPLPSIVGMIDDILQKNIASTPLGSRQIRLEEGGLGEVVVWIGQQKYPLEQVPDAEVKAAIQQAIAEFNSPAKP